MIQAVVTDIDGTLRDEVSGLAPGASQAFAMCRGNGVKTVICTGRNRACVQSDVLSLNPDALITGGGCQIEIARTVVWSCAFPKAVVSRLLSRVQDAGLWWSAETSDEIYMDRAFASHAENDYVSRCGDHAEDSHLIKYTESPPPSGETLERVHKIGVLGSREDLQVLANEFHEHVETIQLRVWGSRWFWEAQPKGVDKGASLIKTLSLLGIAPEACIAFGDSDNDVPMLKAAGIAIAVEGSPSSLLAVSDGLCDRPSRAGIVRELVSRHVVPLK